LSPPKGLLLPDSAMQCLEIGMSTSIRKIGIAIAVMSLLAGAAYAAEEDHRHKEPATATPSGDTGKHEIGMHMHKSDITHKDSDAAMEFEGEAAQLRAQAESHCKLAKLNQGRTGGGGKDAAVNYASVAKHCEQLAKSYHDAAKAAENAAAELAK
jgi:hypothetical protein